MARRSDHTREELRGQILDATRSLIRAEGVGAVSTRKITGKIGYTAGTLYQIFASMDHLIDAVNTSTLNALYLSSRIHADPQNAEESLRKLAQAFLRFTEEHPNEWDAVISYPFGADHVLSEGYTDEVRNLLGMISTSVRDLYDDAEDPRKAEDVVALWCGIYGLFSLMSSRRLVAGHAPERIIEVLADTFLKAKKTTRD